MQYLIRRILITIYCLFLVTVISACVGSSVDATEQIPKEELPPTVVSTDDNDRVNLRFTIWRSNPAHLDMLNRFAETYQEMHPNVTAQFEVILPPDYDSQVMIQVADDNSPDAGWILERSAPTFIQNGILEDLAPVLNQSPDYNLSDLSESALAGWKRGEAIYGIPFSTSPFFILYNQDIFEATGVETPHELMARGEWTWEALVDAAKQIVDASPPGIYGFESVDGAIYLDGFWNTMIPIIRAYNGDAWSADGKTCLLDSPDSVAGIQLYHDMVFVDGSAVPPGTEADFFSGQSGMTIAQLSRLARLQNASFTWEIVPLPGGPAGEVSTFGQAAVGVFAASKHKEEALDFVAFITNKANVAIMAQFFPPARISVLESSQFQNANPLVDAESMKQSVITAIRNGEILPSHVEYLNINLVMRAGLEELWKPNADVQAVMTDICQSIIPFLEK